MTGFFGLSYSRRRVCELLILAMRGSLRLVLLDCHSSPAGRIAADYTPKRQRHKDPNPGHRFLGWATEIPRQPPWIFKLHHTNSQPELTVALAIVIFERFREQI